MVKVIPSSSLGIQKKWFCDNLWYKKDYYGGESESEFIISKMLHDLGYTHATKYSLEKSNVSVSEDFAKDGEFISFYKMLTFYGIDSDSKLFQKKWLKKSPKERLEWIVSYFVEIGFSEYLVKKEFSLMFEIDRLVLNVDRHWKNFGYIRQKNGDLKLHFLFDFGFSLGVSNDRLHKNDVSFKGLDFLSRRTVSKARTISVDFDKQCLVVPAEDYGLHFVFSDHFLNWLNSRNTIQAKRLRKRIIQIYRK